MPRSAWSQTTRLATAAAVAALGVSWLTVPTAASALGSPAATVPLAAASDAPPPPAPDGAVTPDVREVPVPDVDPAAARAMSARSLDGVVALSPGVAATGYAAVGVTWAPGGDVAGQEFFVRTRTGTHWSGWNSLHAEAEHGPTPGSVEASGALPGTDPMVVGDVDAVQVKATASGRAAPQGLTLSVIDPGEQPAARPDERLGPPAYPATGGASGRTPRPAIYSRAQWGADESLRDGFAGYGEVDGSFVHHTVNANDYTRAEVPAILRGIYAYHTQSQGWSDVGYNYLVDRFGRIWEGRWGGIGRPVIGAHTLAYNEESFAMSAIGNFELTQPTGPMLAAYGRLYAWKLSLHGVEADAAANIDGLHARAINGHRDAASTACPGRHLYAKLPAIRMRAANAQAGWAGRRLQRSVVSGPRPDLLARHGADTSVVSVRPGGGGTWVHPAVSVDADWSSYRSARIVGDWDGDSHDDVLARDQGRMWLFAGRGNGHFAPRVGGWHGWAKQTAVAAVGDWTGDGRPDLMARTPGGAAWIHPGQGRDGFAAGYVARSSIGAPTAMFGVGRWDHDGAPDLMTRTQDGALLLWPGNGPGGLEDPARIASGMGGYDQLLGVGDLDRDGHPDLVGRVGASGQLYLLPGRPQGLAPRVPIGSAPVPGALG